MAAAAGPFSRCSNLRMHWIQPGKQGICTYLEQKMRSFRRDLQSLRAPTAQFPVFLGTGNFSKQNRERMRNFQRFRSEGHSKASHQRALLKFSQPLRTASSSAEIRRSWARAWMSASTWSSLRPLGKAKSSFSRSISQGASSGKNT